MDNEPGNDSIDGTEDVPSEEEEPEKKGSKKKVTGSLLWTMRE